MDRQIDASAPDVPRINASRRSVIGMDVAEHNVWVPFLSLWVLIDLCGCHSPACHP